VLAKREGIACSGIFNSLSRRYTMDSAPTLSIPRYPKSTEADRQAFWDAAAVGALTTVVRTYPTPLCTTAQIAERAAEIADLLLVERMQRIDNKEI
jgi:hypothetical protein